MKLFEVNIKTHGNTFARKKMSYVLFELQCNLLFLELWSHVNLRPCCALFFMRGVGLCFHVGGDRDLWGSEVSFTLY